MTKIRVIVNGEEVPAPGPASFETLRAVAIEAVREIRGALLAAAEENTKRMAQLVTMPEDEE